MQIVVEALIALALGIVGASLNAPQLKEISWASEMKKMCVMLALFRQCQV
jgi:Ca2+/Na+ antiporter